MLTEKLCFCGQGTPFNVFFCNAGYFIKRPTSPRTRPVTHPVGPAHFGGYMSKKQDNVLPSNPTSVPSDQFFSVNFFYYYFLCFVRFTVSRDFD